MTGLAVIVICLAVLAAACAFVITTGEWGRRFPPRKARREGLRAAAVTFAIFAGLGLVIVAVTLR